VSVLKSHSWDIDKGVSDGGLKSYEMLANELASITTAGRPQIRRMRPYNLPPMMSKPKLPLWR